jgi:hypothetical protein
MAINTTFADCPQNNTTTFIGRVLEVRKVDRRRDHSDTLDYTDFRMTTCTEALVYVGREKPKYDWCKPSETNPIVAVAPENRFTWVDCTNLFTWRGEGHRTATVDVDWTPEMAEDFAAYVEYNEVIAAEQEAKRLASEAAAKKAADEAEKNRPVLGKQMVVVSGRKVPKGTKGTVAFIHSNGGVLLKDNAVWQDRKAQGVWVDARNLAAC